MMSDMRVVMREFRFLDEKRKLGGLTPAEEQRWVDLKQNLGIAAGPSAGYAGYADGQVSAEMGGGGPAQGYYGADGNWYPYPDGYDPAQGYPGGDGGAQLDPNAAFDPTAMGAEIEANLPPVPYAQGDDPSGGFNAPVDAQGYAAMNDGFSTQVAPPQGEHPVATYGSPPEAYAGYGTQNGYPEQSHGHDAQHDDLQQAAGYDAQHEYPRQHPGPDTQNDYPQQAGGYDVQHNSYRPQPSGHDSQHGYPPASPGSDAQHGHSPQSPGYGTQQLTGHLSPHGPGQPMRGSAFGLSTFGSHSAGETFGTGAGFASQAGFARPPPTTSPYGKLPSPQPSWATQDRDESINLGNDLRDEENPRPPASAEPAEVDDSDVMEVDGDDVMSVDEPSPSTISAKPSSYKPPASFMLPTPLTTQGSPQPRPAEPRGGAVPEAAFEEVSPSAISEVPEVPPRDDETSLKLDDDPSLGAWPGPSKGKSTLWTSPAQSPKPLSATPASTGFGSKPAGTLPPSPASSNFGLKPAAPLPTAPPSTDFKPNASVPLAVEDKPAEQEAPPLMAGPSVGAPATMASPARAIAPPPEATPDTSTASPPETPAVPSLARPTPVEAAPEWAASPSLPPELPPEPSTVAADPSEWGAPASDAPVPRPDEPVIDLLSSEVSNTGEHQKLDLDGSPDDKIPVTSSTDYDSFGSATASDSRAIELDASLSDDAIRTGSLSDIAGNPSGEESGYDGAAVPLATNADFLSAPDLLSAGVRGSWSPDAEPSHAPQKLSEPALEWGQSSQELGPPSHDLGPPSHDLGPPSHDLGPPSHDLGPPSQDLGPPSHDLGPSENGLRPSGPALGDDLPAEEVPLEFTGEHPVLAAPAAPLEEEPPTREFHRALNVPHASPALLASPPRPPLEDEPPTRELHRPAPLPARGATPFNEPDNYSVAAAKQANPSTPNASSSAQRPSPDRLTSNAPTAHASTFALPASRAIPPPPPLGTGDSATGPHPGLDPAALPPLLEEEEKTVQREVPAELVRAAQIGNVPTSEFLKPREPSVIVAPPSVPALSAKTPPASDWEDVDLDISAPPPPPVEADLDEIAIEPDDEDELEIEEPPARSTTPTPAPVRAAAPAKGKTKVRPALVKGEHRVVVHTVEGQVKRGTIRDAELAAATLTLEPQGGGAKETIPNARIKAVFFMAAPGSKPPPLTGKKIKVTFIDGRQIAGASTDYDENVSGFFLVPADTRAHTSRIYVVSAAVKNVAVS